MTAFTEKLDRAASQATCNVLDSIGGGLVGAAGYSLVFGGPVAVPIAAGAAAFMAARTVCDWDSDKPAPPNTAFPFDICSEGGSSFSLITYKDDGSKFTDQPGIAKITRWSKPTIWPFCDSGTLYSRRFYFVDTQGRSRFNECFNGTCDGASYYFTQEWDGDPTCNVPGPSTVPTYDLPPTTYTDPDDGCTLIVNYQGMSLDQAGQAYPVFKMEPSPEQLRADGGVISGCNFEPVIYTGVPGGGGGGLPPTVGPWNPDWDGDGQTPWGDFLRDLAGGLIGNVLYDGLQQLTEIPFDPVEYRIDPSCNSSDPPELPVVIEVPYLKGLQSVITRIDALVPLLQAQKDLKQPICNVRPTREGEWRTISFRSEETSPFGKSRLRKRFRYLSLSGIGLEQLVDYWEGFSFEAGPVIVSHIGASWGEPKVWAFTADEGKRVIRHAGGEAGLDPDQVGQWQISSSRSARYGVSGTMNVDTTGGYFRITARDGASERPIVART